MKMLNLLLALLLVFGSLPAAFANDEVVSSSVPTNVNTGHEEHEEVEEPYPPVNQLETVDSDSHTR